MLPPWGASGVRMAEGLIDTGASRFPEGIERETCWYRVQQGRGFGSELCLVREDKNLHFVFSDVTASAF